MPMERRHLNHFVTVEHGRRLPRCPDRSEQAEDVIGDQFGRSIFMFVPFMVAMAPPGDPPHAPRTGCAAGSG